MTLTDPSVSSLNAILESIQSGFSKCGRTKQDKIDKLKDMNKYPENQEELISLLSWAYGKQDAVIKKLQKQLIECEDILEEYEPCETRSVKDVIYYFDYPTQTLWDTREKTIKCGKYHRKLGTYTMY